MIPNDLTSSGLSGAKPASLERAKQLAATLLSERGEVSGALVARQLHDALGALDASDRHSFQRYLATEFQPDKATLRAAAERYLAEGTAESAAALAQAADPPRQELLRRMNMAPRGTGALIAMRSEIASCLRGEPELSCSAPTSSICSHPGSTAAFSNCGVSTGKRRRRCWRS